MFHLDLKLLRAAAAVAADGSVTRAAERLNLSQPAVSGQIAALERALGFALFHRSTRRLGLSAEGERLLPLIRTLLEDAERLRRAAEDLRPAETRRFRLGAAIWSLAFAERSALLDGFAVAAPQLGYAIDNRLQCAQVRDLVDGRLDVAILLGQAAAITLGDAERAALERGAIVNETVYPASLDRVVLGRRRVELLLPAASPLAGHAVIPEVALAGTRIAMLSREHGETMIAPLARFLEGCGAVLEWPAEGNALAVADHARRHGIVALATGWFPPPPGMVARPVAGLVAALELAVVLGTAANRAARHFFDFARSMQAQTTNSLPATQSSG